MNLDELSLLASISKKRLYALEMGYAKPHKKEKEKLLKTLKIKKEEYDGEEDFLYPCPYSEKEKAQVSLKRRPWKIISFSSLTLSFVFFISALFSLFEALPDFYAHPAFYEEELVSLNQAIVEQGKLEEDGRYECSLTEEEAEIIYSTFPHEYGSTSIASYFPYSGYECNFTFMSNLFDSKGSFFLSGFDLLSYNL